MIAAIIIAIVDKLVGLYPLFDAAKSPKKHFELFRIPFS